MMDTNDQKPWAELAKLVANSSPDQVEAFLGDLSAHESARAFSRLDSEDQKTLLSHLDVETLSDLIKQFPEEQAAQIIDQLQPKVAAAILNALPSSASADLLAKLKSDTQESILAVMNPALAKEARLLTEYPENVAGGLMNIEYLTFLDSATVGDVLYDLRGRSGEYRDYEIQYAYVTNNQGQLVGVIPLRGLLLAQTSDPIHQMMIQQPMVVNHHAPLSELRDFFERHRFLGVPVVNDRNEIVGVVQRSAVERALAKQSDTDYRRSQGIIGGEELRTMPLLLRSRRRLGWLSVNIMLNVLAASVIAFYQDTLSSVIALAVFLPIISDMSGCSGNQAVAVSMRELALGVTTSREILWVLLKEALVGCLNGTILGLLIAIVAWCWKGNLYLGLVVGGALAINSLVAVSIGGTLPLILKRFGIDPALASGPILTTVTDMVGFFLVLSFATALLQNLTS